LELPLLSLLFPSPSFYATLTCYHHIKKHEPGTTSTEQKNRMEFRPAIAETVRTGVVNQLLVSSG